MVSPHPNIQHHPPRQISRSHSSCCCMVRIKLYLMNPESKNMENTCPTVKNPDSMAKFDEIPGPKNPANFLTFSIDIFDEDRDIIVTKNNAHGSHGWWCSPSTSGQESMPACSLICYRPMHHYSMTFHNIMISELYSRLKYYE